MRYRGGRLYLTVALAVLLVGLGGLVRGSAGDQLVGEGSLVLAGDTAVVVLLVRVGLIRVVWSEEKRGLVRGFRIVDAYDMGGMGMCRGRG